jgi:PhzF family phenazine biosynthesis protein
MNEGSLYRLAAFTTDPAGGNPAGVWIGDRLPEIADMQRIAEEVGYSETAFIAPTSGTTRTVRYYSPEKEISFCGHATIASGVMFGELEGEGKYTLDTLIGAVSIDVRMRDGQREAALTSVTPRHERALEALVDEALVLLRWKRADMDTAIPPARAYAGVWHLILAVHSSARLENLSYDFEGLKALMLREDLTTLQLIWREMPDRFHARNPFPVGGVVEDPATGAAAAALGGYLRDAGYLEAPAEITILQGEAMGRPSVLRVTIPEMGGIVVSGMAVHIT